MKTIILTGILIALPVFSFSQELESASGGDTTAWNLRCYPNPTSDLLIVSSSVEIKDITLIDLNGQVIKAPKMPNWCFSLHDLPQGWLFVYVESMDGRVEKRNVFKN